MIMHRDKYINIVWENVIEDAKENFRQYSDPVDDHLGLPYDYGSIMHYQSNAFSVNGNDTIIPIYANGNVIGQRVRTTNSKSIWEVFFLLHFASVSVT